MTHKVSTTLYALLTFLILIFHASHALDSQLVPPKDGYTLKEISYKDLPERGYIHEYVPKEPGEKLPSAKGSSVNEELKESGLTNIQFLPDAFEMDETDESDASGDVDASFRRFGFSRFGFSRFGYGGRFYWPYRRMAFMRQPFLPPYFYGRRFFSYCNPMFGCRYVYI
ncbi:13998_t:CDS:1 [Acaulospora morrowiae]|uniref:13998_t:CDS:1 n=1 Tax=Acaulospora morrowiae TaxID=94023 RepID=A0A9N8WFS3_9GLOM|nr:13998_t:CDS:1 [Acaulospora morrowiae]